MGLVVETPPEVEPVTVDELKVHARIDGNHEDARLLHLIASARAYIERVTGLAMIEQTRVLVLDRFPREDDPCGSVLRVDYVAPVSAVESIKYDDEAGVEQTMDDSLYVTDLRGERLARIGLVPGAAWPATRETLGAVRVTVTAGYGESPEDVEPDLRQAVLLLAGHWYRNPEAVVTGTIATDVHHSLSAMLDAHRIL